MPGYLRLLALLGACMGPVGITAVGITAVGWAASPALAESRQCEPQEIATKYPSLAGRTLRVGISAADKPASYRDEADPDKITGLDAEYATAAFACIGVPFRFSVAGWSGLMPALVSGQIDVMWDQLYYNADRAKLADFILYSSSGSAIVVSKGNPKNIHAFEDLCGLKTVGQIGSTEIVTMQGLSRNCVAAHKPEIDIDIAQDRPSALRALSNHRVDAYLGIAVTAYDPAEYEIAYRYNSGVKIGVAVHKGDKDLAQAIYDAISILQADGTARKFYATFHVDPSLMVPAQILLQ